jgi:copper oxidase (laccase) domain-containing protein
LGGALGNAIEILVGQFHVERRDLCAAFGPSIGPCCYTLPEDLAGPLRVRSSACVVSTQTGARVDLRVAAALELSRLGVAEPVVDVPCTRCNAGEYFSARGAVDGTTGRQLAAIWRTVPEHTEKGKLRLRIV